MTRPAVSLLGPQRFQRNAADVLRTRGLSGPLALITAGWQERERDDQEIRDHLGGRVVNLELHARSERIFEADAELARAHRERQVTLRRVQELYDFRLGHAMEAARQLLRRKGEIRYLGPERLAAIEAVRDLDARHLARLREIHGEYESRWNPGGRDHVARERRDVARLIAESAAVGIAGGHVAVLLNRLRLFDLPGLVGDRPVLAWAAGAMAVSDRVVLFYDDPPHGPGNPEVLEAGLGLVSGVVPLPHAERRLKLDDPARVALFARRFAPARCLALEAGSRIDWRDGAPVVVNDDACGSPRGVRELTPDGDVVELEAR